MMPNSHWPTRALIDLLDIDVPIVQAPMAGAQGPELAAAVSAAGGLGSLPCAMLTPDAARTQVAEIRAATNRGFALNFFCHRTPDPNPAAEAKWRERLGRYYVELEVEPPVSSGIARAPFDEAFCTVVEEVRPKVVSFHFGLPDDALLARVKSTGAKILSSATTPAEARWLADKGVDAIIAQGAEAGGHRGMFLADDVAAQVGTFALLPQVVDAVDLPVVASGGIMDGRGIVAALALGAAAVQMGTAFLTCREAGIPEAYKQAIVAARDDGTRLTRAFSGRPARGIVNRFMTEMEAPGPGGHILPFPLQNALTRPLRAAAAQQGRAEYLSLWAGQGARLARLDSATDLVARLAREIDATLGRLAPRSGPAPA
jgi:nitronate monooxygenase